MSESKQNDYDLMTPMAKADHYKLGFDSVGDGEPQNLQLKINEAFYLRKHIEDIQAKEVAKDVLLFGALICLVLVWTFVIPMGAGQ